MPSSRLLPRLLPLLAVVTFLFAGAPPVDASVRMTIEPAAIVADGHSTATISVEVRTLRGQLVSDGTPVHFATTGGTITPVTYTAAGVARAVLTAGTVPASVIVTAFAGTEQAIGKLQLVSELVEANVDGRVLRVNAGYVAFSEELHFLDCMQDVRLRFRGLTLDANAAQIDLNQNILRAFGKIGLTSGDKVLEGDRLFLNLTTFDGYLLSADKKVWFNGFGLSLLPEPPKGETPQFEFTELTSSTLSWIGKEAVYIPGVKVQLRGAHAFVGGIKALRLPYHEARLDGGLTGDSGQYLGVGSDGLVIDLPLYVDMTPNATTAVRFRDGERTGFGYFTGRPGFGLDLEERYGVPTQNDGLVTMSSITSPDWGFHWNHTQQFGPQTRVTAVFDTPTHSDYYSQVNVSQGLKFGNVTLNLAGSQLENRAFGRTVDAGFNTLPKPLFNNKLFLTMGTRYTDIAGGQFETLLNRQFEIQPTHTGEVNMSLRPETWTLFPKMSAYNNVTMRLLFGTTSGPALAYQSGLVYSLPRNITMTFGYNYDQAPTIVTLIHQAHHNLSLTASMAPVPGLRASLFGTMGIDSLSQTVAGQVSYAVTKQWRVELLQSYYQFNGFGVVDYQFGVARKLGQRELLLYYSTQYNKVLFELAASQF